MNAEQWNELYPAGTPVFAYPGCRPEDFPNDTRLVTRTRSKAEVLGGHTDVVWVNGHDSCIALSHVDPVAEEQFEKARAEETAAAVAAMGALPVSVGDQPQPLDDQRLAEALAAYEGHPDLGFACCSAHAVVDHVPALRAEVQRLRSSRWDATKVTADLEDRLHAMHAELTQALARVAELEKAAEQIRFLHKDSPMGPCPTARLAGAKDFDPPGMRHAVRTLSPDEEATR